MNKLNHYELKEHDTTKMVAELLTNLGYVVEDIDGYKMLNIDGTRAFFKLSDLCNLGLIGQTLATDKYLAIQFLKHAGVSVAKSKMFESNEKEEAKKYMYHLTSSVIKPYDGLQSKGVTVDVIEDDEFHQAWEKALNTSRNKKVLIEEYFSQAILGRYFVVNGKCIAVVEFTRPFVKGNGKDTIETLINKKNIIRKQNPHLKNDEISTGEQTQNFLKGQGYHLESIPKRGKHVLLDNKANPHVGSDTIDSTDKVHPTLKIIAEKAAKAIPGLYVVGVDILAKNHQEEPTLDNYIVNEVNRKPGSGGHLYPLYGKPRNVVKAIVQYILRIISFENLKEKVNTPSSYMYGNYGKIDINELVLNEFKTQSYNATKLLSQEFKKCGYEGEFIDKYFVVNLNNNILAFNGTLSSNFSFFSSKIVKKRYWQRKFLSEDGLSVSKGKFFKDMDREIALDYAMGLKKPIVLNYGKKEYSINTEEEFNNAWETLSERYNTSNYSYKKGIFIAEQFQDAVKARYLIIDGLCVGVTQFMPASVKGNGIDSIEKLIEEKNNIRIKNPHLKTKLIIMDQEKQEYLNKQGLDLDYIPKENEGIYLSERNDLLNGADTFGITHSVHPKLKEIAERASKIMFGMDIVKIDILAKNHFQEPSTEDYVINDIVIKPTLGEFQFPLYGDSVNIAKEIVDYSLRWAIGKKDMDLFITLTEEAEVMTSHLINKKDIEDEKQTQYQVRYIISGKVQRMRFRKWIQKQALDFGLDGFCRNRSDGKVEAVLSSEEKELLEAFKKILEDGPIGVKVKKIAEKSYEKEIEKGFKILKDIEIKK